MSIHTVRRCCLAVLALGALLAAPRGAFAEDAESPILTLAKERVKDPKKPFTLTVSLKVKEKSNDKFEAAFAKARKATLKEKGCLNYDLNRDTKDAQTYLVYERWSSIADLEAHLKSDHIKELLAALADLLDGPPDVGILLPASE